MGNYWLDLIEDENICKAISDGAWPLIGGKTITVADLIRAMSTITKSVQQKYPNMLSYLSVNPIYQMKKKPTSPDGSDALVYIRGLIVQRRRYILKKEVS